MGACYMDQEKGWTLLNRGKVIGNIPFNIEALVRGLGGKKCADELLQLEAIKRQLKKYEYMHSVAEYQEAIHEVGEDIEYDAPDEVIDRQIEVVRKTWEQCKDKENSIDNFERAITNHCQKNLYDAHIKEIKSRIESEFVELTAGYMAEVKKCVTDEYSRLSGEAQKEPEKVFVENENGPLLQDVSVGLFERIKFALLGYLPFNWAKEQFIEQYAKRVRDKLMGNGRSYGVFAIGWHGTTRDAIDVYK